MDLRNQIRIVTVTVNDQIRIGCSLSIRRDTPDQGEKSSVTKSSGDNHSRRVALLGASIYGSSRFGGGGDSAIG